MTDFATRSAHESAVIGKAVVRAITRRSRAVHVPGWVGGLKLFRAFTPRVVDRQAPKSVPAADREMAANDLSGLVGPGGTASDIPRILHAALGLPIRVIDGLRVPQKSDWRPKAVNWREAV